MSNRMARVATAGQQGELWRIYALVSRKGQCGVLSLSFKFGLSGKIRRHGSPLNAYLISETIQQCGKLVISFTSFCNCLYRASGNENMNKPDGPHVHTPSIRKSKVEKGGEKKQICTKPAGSGYV